MDITLTPELEQLVQSKVETGRYHSANDVMREALHLMEERDRFRAEIRQKIEEGLASAREGRLVDGDVFFEQMEAELEEELRAEQEQAHLKAS